jgi:2-methylisoborneol synthase
VSIGYAERPWGDGTAPPLYCPAPARVDDVLAAEVDERLVSWGRTCGFDEAELEKLRAAGFGRLATLTHPDTDDPDSLLVAAQLNAAWWAADDYYSDDTALGAVAELLPPRLSLVMAAVDPLPPAGDHTPPLEEALRDDPVLVALASGFEHLARHGTAAQVQRVCHATAAMFVSWSAYAAWRHTGKNPPAWEYLAARQHDSFYTSMTLIDAVGGYELPANLFYAPAVRRAATRAGTASVIVNDLLSVAKDAADDVPVCNLVLLTADDRGCSVREATEITVRLHNDVVRAFEDDHRALRDVPSVDLQRFLEGLRAWMGGSFEWHTTNPRYR